MGHERHRSLATRVVADGVAIGNFSSCELQQKRWLLLHVYLEQEKVHAYKYHDSMKTEAHWQLVEEDVRIILQGHQLLCL